jgi:hypothetical protein
VYTGHFAECDTRQRGALPSVSAITLGKEPRPGHRYRFFAECNVSGTRQRSMLCRVPYQALGKVPDMGTPSGGFFAECYQADTRQRYLLCRVSPGTLGKEACFVECHIKHSAKYLTWGPPLADSLPSAIRQTLGKGNFFTECHLGHSAKTPSPSSGAVTAAFLCRVPSGTRQIALPSAREKVLSKEGFADALCVEPSLPSATLDKAFVECF